MGWIKKPPRNGTRRRPDTRRMKRMEVYNTAMWRRLRLIKLRGAPLCEVCSLKGRITPGTDVHHLRSFTSASDPAERDSLAYDIGNLLTVCDRCHNELHHGVLKGAATIEEIKERLKEL